MMRPSIVTAAWKEPVAGWVDNLNGPTGILAAAGVGLMQTMYAKRYKRADLIPVDIACNMLCVLAWKAGNTLSQGQKIDIYNCTSGESAPVTWGHVEKAMSYFTTKYPLEKMTKAMKVLEYFSTKEWYWDTRNVGLLYDTVH